MLFLTAQDQEDYFKSAEFLNNCHKSLNTCEYVQLNKTAYTDFKSLSMSSTKVVALVPTSTSASITLISAIHVVLIEFMKKRNRKFVLWRISFLDKVWGYPKFQGFSAERLW